MNIYKILVFDGYSSKSILISGYDLIGAIQCNGSINQNQIIRVEFVGSENEENFTNNAT